MRLHGEARILRNRATPPTSRVCSENNSPIVGCPACARHGRVFAEAERGRSARTWGPPHLANLENTALLVTHGWPAKRPTRVLFVRFWGHGRFAYARGSVCGILRNRATLCAVVGLFVLFAGHEPYSIVKDQWAEPLTRMPLGAADYAKRSESQYQKLAPLVGGREFPCVRVAVSEGKAEPPPVRDCLFCCD